MTPVTRSLHFFGFFAFHGRASTVFGPRVYLLFTGVYDTRMAVFVALLITRYCSPGSTRSKAASPTPSRTLWRVHSPESFYRHCICG